MNKDLPFLPLVKHNIRMFAFTGFAVWAVVYGVLFIRYYEYAGSLKIQVLLLSISVFFVLVYIAFVLIQLLLDCKKKRMVFQLEPIVSLITNGFSLSFSTLLEWNYAGSYCWVWRGDKVYIELDIDRVASEQKSYLQLRIRPDGYKKKDYTNAEFASKLKELNGIADKRSLVFYMEESVLKNISSENFLKWYTNVKGVARSN